jgi:hypothetical protein
LPRAARDIWLHPNELKRQFEIFSAAVLAAFVLWFPCSLNPALPPKVGGNAKISRKR